MAKKQAYNPYLPEGVYIPDGEPHVFGNRVYVYGSHDKCGSTRYCPGDYVVWSAPTDNLADWSNSGISYSRRGVHNRLGMHCMWAPDCVKGADGRFYLYYCFNFDNKICVAVSEKPDRGFSYYGLVKHANGVPYGKGSGDIMCFDPAVFRDDDGRVYLYSGYSANEDLRRMLRMRGIKNCDGTGSQVMELEEDMLTLMGDPRMIIPGYKNSAGTGFEGHEMYEASSMRKFNGRYYFIYSSRLSHELAYAVSDYPDRGFKFGGAIISNGDIGYNGRTERQAVNYWGNVHGSVECIGGRYYVFYHRQTNKNEQSRQGCAEQIEIAADGSIKQVEMTSCGLNGGPLAGRGVYPAYIACNLYSAQGAVKCAYGPFSRHKYAAHPYIGEYEKGRQCINAMADGATAGFKYFSMQGRTRISVTVRGAEGVMEVRTSPEGSPLAEIPLRGDGKWHTASAVADLPQGKAALYFTFRGKGRTDFLSFGLEPEKNM